ncbi:MAG TPA: aminotransferase class IV [Pirellulales bacterium]
MNEPLAYLNGQLLPASQAVVPVYDAGFVLGATVTEQLRTFGGELFRLPEHLERLKHSLARAEIQPDVGIGEMAEIATRLVAHNRGLIDSADDLGLCIFVTPGPYAAMAEGDVSGPSVGLHTYRLPFQLWEKYSDEGVSLATTAIEQVPAACWPAELKCRSRMHYFLADRLAAKQFPGSRALLLDAAGRVMETSTANIVVYSAAEGLISPPISQILPGISLQVLSELAAALRLPIVKRTLLPDEVARADEVFITSTPNCILPVTRFNGQPIGSGKPGKVFTQILSAWDQFVGLDIAGQAKRFAQR